MATSEPESLATFAVVGRVNKGKSSIVSTFTEDDSVRIDPKPGTTKRTQTFHLKVRGRVLFAIVDTPGFEQPRAVLEWLQAHSETASDRPAAVRRFVEEFGRGGKFSEECELLRPILDGAGILYVADVSLPYRRNYETEMEILRWTGRPRIALVNRTRKGDHETEWRRALDQYFSIVRTFDAHHSGFPERLALLRAFRELDVAAAEGLDEALELLESDWIERRRESARLIAQLLVDAVTMKIERPAGEGEPEKKIVERWQGELRAELRERERRERRQVEVLYRHDTLEREEAPLTDDAMAGDLFATATWRVLGLDQWQLTRAGVVGGAAVGGTLDAMAGGGTFLAGTVIGGLVGGLTSYLAAGSAARIEIIGRPIGGRVAVIGPIGDPNFAWLLLDRAVLHHRSVVGRPHALRTPLVLREEAAKQGPSSGMDAKARARIAPLLDRARKASASATDELVSALSGELESVLAC